MTAPRAVIPCAKWKLPIGPDLLERRISKLGLRLEGTTLEPLIRQLYDELSAKDSRFIHQRTSAMNGVRDFVQGVEEHVRQYRMPHSRRSMPRTG